MEKQYVEGQKHSLCPGMLLSYRSDFSKFLAQGFDAIIRGNKSWPLVVLMCLGFLAAACSTNNELVSPEGAAVLQRDCVIEPGDVCRILAFGHEDLSREYVVDSSGRIDLGDVEISLNGLACDEAEQSILEVAPQSGQVGVECFRNHPVCITGEVANPGCYPYVPGMRIVDAIAMAGGFTYRAMKDEWICSSTRADGDGKLECAGREALVMPGDIIEVPERFF